MHESSRATILGASIALSVLTLPLPAAHAQRPTGGGGAAAADTLGRGAAAMDTTPSHHALVLSGGSARGLAHGGALLALEQLGYDPPVVVGTSMGAIMGALYAAGYEPEQIWAVTGVERWLARFSARPVAIGPDRVPVRPLLEIGIGRGRAHEGLVSGIGVNQRLVELLFDAGVRARNDFDRLPRRFRAVAADLSTGEQVVLGTGDLPRAVRASMAVPGAFAPVVWNDRVLVDGGVANNLPVSVARSMTDLPIIAVDVLAPTLEIVERGALDVGVRGLRLLIANARPPDSTPDILVVPRLPAGITAGGFPANPTERLRTGFEAVLEQVPPLSRPQSDGRRPAGSRPAAIGQLVIEGGDPAVARLAASLYGPAVGAYDPDVVLRRTRALYATNLFQAIWPRLEFGDGDDAPATLVVDLTPAARTSIAGSARWDNDVGAAGWASLRHRASLYTPIELSASGRVSNLEARASIDAAAFSGVLPGLIWNAGLHAGEERLRRMETDTAGRPRVRRAGGWAGAELHGGDLFLSILGRVDHVRDDGTGHDDWSAGPFLRVMPGPAPDRIVGIEPLLELEAWILGATYRRGRASAGLSRRFGETRTAALADIALGSADTPRDALPAATRELTPWLPVGTLRARHRATAGIDVAHPLVLEGYARLRVRLVAAADDQDALGHSTAWRGGAEIGAVWPTFVGAIEIGVAAGAGGWRLNVSAGP